MIMLDTTSLAVSQAKFLRAHGWNKSANSEEVTDSDSLAHVPLRMFRKVDGETNHSRGKMLSAYRAKRCE
jgi:hypothetical protein